MTKTLPRGLPTVFRIKTQVWSCPTHPPASSPPTLSLALSTPLYLVVTTVFPRRCAGPLYMNFFLPYLKDSPPSGFHLINSSHPSDPQPHFLREGFRTTPSKQVKPFLHFHTTMNLLFSAFISIVILPIFVKSFDECPSLPLECQLQDNRALICFPHH